MRMQFRNHKSAQWTKLPRYCSQVFPSFCRYRKWKDELIDGEEVARKMEPRARVELATCRLRIGCSTTELPRHSVYYQQFSVNLRIYSSRFSHNSQDVPISRLKTAYAVSVFRVMTSASSAIAAAFCDSSIITYSRAVVSTAARASR